MLSFVYNFEGINHRYFNREQYRYLHLIPRKLHQFFNRVKALCLLCGAKYACLGNSYKFIRVAAETMALGAPMLVIS